MKKILSLVALLLALVMCLGVFASCEEKPGPGPDSESLEGTYNIKVWVAEKAVELTKTQIDNFNATNDLGITINATIEAVGEGDAATSMTTDIEAGADIFCFAQDQAARLVQAGALSKLGTAAAKTVTDANDAGVVASAKSGDDLWAYPLTSDNGYFMYYDKSVINASHLGSLEDIIADCEKAGKFFSMELEGSAWYAASFFFATGCVSDWTTDNDGAFISVNDTFNSEKGLVAAKGMYKLVSSKAYNNSSACTDFAAATPSAVVISGTWDYETAKDILGANLGVAELPSFTVDGNTYHLGSFNGCKLMGVKPQTDVKKAAVLHKLAQYLTGEACQMERFNTLSWGPSNLVDQQSEAVKANPGLAALLAQSPYSVPQGQIHGSWWDIGKALPANIKAATDEAGLKSALEAYEQAMASLFTMTADEKDAFTVIGSICGTSWDTDFEMIQKPEGTWFSKDALLLNAGDEFQTRQGKSWDVQFGAVGDDGNSTKSNFVVPETGYYFVKLVYDKATGTGVVSLVGNNPVSGFTVIGSINGDTWTIDIEMDIQPDGTYKTTEPLNLEAGNEFKVRQGHSWDVAYPANNYVVETAGTFYIVLDPATGTVSLVAGE
ncbi:MAG: hypothetical protein KBS59_00795 [Clostridiales bacterium]|nr:hypothetical protein [Clostridiales bacterium]